MTDPFLSFEGFKEIRRRFLAVAEDLDLPKVHPSGPEFAPPGELWKVFMSDNLDPDTQENYEEETRWRQEDGLEGFPIPRFALPAVMYGALGSQTRDLDLEGFPSVRAQDVPDEFLEAAERHGLTCVGVEMHVHGAHPSSLLGSECEVTIVRTWVLTEHQDPDGEPPWLVSKTAEPPLEREKKPHLYLV